MGKPTGSTNPIVRKLLRSLRDQGKEKNARIWLELAERLEGSRRSRAEVNLGQLNRYTTEGSTVLVPGKVLAAGKLEHPVTIAALTFSAPARRKVVAAGGSVLTLRQLMERNPEGKNVKLME